MTDRITSQIWTIVKAIQRLLTNLSWTTILFLVHLITNQGGRLFKVSTKITFAKALNQAESAVFLKEKPSISRKSRRQSRNLQDIKNPIFMPQSSDTNTHKISTRVWQTLMQALIRAKIRTISKISLACKLKLMRTCWTTKIAFKEMPLQGQDIYLRQIRSKY